MTKSRGHGGAWVRLGRWPEKFASANQKKFNTNEHSAVEKPGGGESVAPGGSQKVSKDHDDGVLGLRIRVYLRTRRQGGREEVPQEPWG